MNWKKIFIWLWPLFVLLTIPPANPPLALMSLSPKERQEISQTALQTLFVGSYVGYAKFIGGCLKDFHMYVYRLKDTEREQEWVLNPQLYPATLFVIGLLWSFWFWLKKPGWFSACCTLFVGWGLCGYFGVATIGLAGTTW